MTTAPAIDEVLARIDDALVARLPCWTATGVALAVTDRERTLGYVCRGVGDLTTGEPVTPDSRFQIGSVGKSFAAVIAMQEVEAGHLSLDAPVTDYLPWFSVRSRFAPITLHHLLTHTAGLIQGTDFSLDGVHQVWALRDTEVVSPPGTRFSYSNDGYKLVGLVLEAVTGRPFPELLTERLLDPLGMADSDPAITLATRETVALPHQRLYDDRLPHAGQPRIVSPWYETGTADGSIVSSATDMVAYARLWLGRGETPGGRFVSDESWGRLAAPHAEDPDEPGAWYGYGQVTRELDGRTLVGHSGSMVGYSSYLMTDPEAGLAVVVLLNGEDDRFELVRYALAACRAAAAGAPVLPPPPPDDPTVIIGAEAFEGTYRLHADWGGDEAEAVKLAARGGRVVLVDGGREIALERHTGDVFLLPGPGWDRFPLQAFRDEEGVVVELWHGPDWFGCPRYRGPRGFPARPEWQPFVGHYRSWSAWITDLRVFERKGRLWASGPWIEAPACELELVPLGDATFRVGADEWRPDRLTFDCLVEGRATRAVYDQAPLYRAFTP